MGATTPFKLWSIRLPPAVNGGMVHLQSTFLHDFFEISVTERIAKIPANTQQNNVCLEVAPFERILALVAHGGDLFRSFLPTVADQLCLCNTSAMSARHPSG